jgi:hypothetical protein
VSAENPLVSDTDCEHESPIIGNTYWVIRVILPKCAQHWGGIFVVRRPPPTAKPNEHICHGSAGTPLGTHAIGQDSGLEESRPAICT